MLSHSNLAVAVYGYLHISEVTEDRTAMCFLPLAHVFEVRLRSACAAAPILIHH